MKKVYIGTNWKMTKTLTEGQAYCEELVKTASSLHDDIELFIIPSYPLLWPIKQTIESSRLLLGAQNMHWQTTGAYTGEVSPAMLQEIGIDVVELGHSERRQYYNENDEDINKKVRAALQFNIKPLVCIGETLAQKENDVSIETLAVQLKVCLKGVPTDQVEKLWVAYEPVWAIGENGQPAAAEYVGYIHQKIRQTLVEMFGEEGRKIPLLYGGSVNEQNFQDYLQMQEVDGLFIGRAAWNMDSFKRILAEVSQLVV